jgi:PAS domain S-box-containing protein
MALGRTIIDGADEGSRRNLTRLQLPELKKGKNKPRPYRGVCYSRVCDLDQNESVLDTSTTRNQRCRGAGASKFRLAQLCVPCIGIGLCVCLGLIPAAVAAPMPPTPTRQEVEVLFLSSLDPDLPDVDAMIEQAETRILSGSDRPVHFSFEYLESASSFGDATRQKASATYLLEKYRGQTFDLVIAINEETVALAEQMRAKLCPDAALLFFVVDPKDPSIWLSQKPGRTGVIREVNYLPTLQLALLQNPGTAHVIVVSGASDAEKLDAKLASEQFRVYESSLEFQYLTNLQFSELGLRLQHVSPDGIILFLDFITDSHGEQFIPARILPAISKAADRPIYGTFSSVVGGGVVGGSVADLGEVGRALGDDGVRILKGEKPEQIAVTTGDFQHYMVDWRQLHRWGFPENQLPEGSDVRFSEYSPWELYRWRILGIFALLLVETLLIVLLLRNIAKRKRAQETLRQKDEDLAEAQRLARVGSWQWDTQNEVVTWSEELYRLHGLDPKLPLPPFKEFSRFFTPESFARLSATIKAALQTGYVQDLELEVVRADGSTRWVAAGGEAVRDATGRVTYLRGTVQDITERRQADEARFRLASIVQSSDDAIISKNLDGIIMSWNPGAERIFGFSAADAIGQSMAMIIPPELRGEEKTILQKTRAGEKVEHYETVRMTKEGKQINVSLTVSPMRDAAGTIVGASKIARDITKQRRAEEELKKSEERFSKAFRQSPMALSLVSANTSRYLDINKAFERMWGYTRADVVGKSALEIGLWVNPAERARLTQKLQSEGSLREVECEWRSKDGRTLIALVSIELIESGGEPCFLAVVADITDRKRAEQALLESERRFRLMANTAPVMIWTSGLDELCDYVNQRWLEFTGRPLAAELGLGWLEGVHPQDLTACMSTFSTAFSAHQPFQVQYRLRRHDGQYRWILDAAVPRFNLDDSFAGYIGSCIDITDQKVAGEVLFNVGRKLIEAQEEERRRIARELHDDINQRMALLANGLQEVGQAISSNEDVSQKKELRDLWQLTNEIATDIEHMSRQLHPSKLHYLGLAAAVRDLCQESSRQLKIEIECVVRDLPEDLDEGTSLSLFRTVQESLRNVGKHSQAHHVKVELTRRLGMILLCVTDDGAGFDTDDVGNSRGLGLVSMRERLRSVGGEFSISSQPSQGTKVEGYVPAILKSRRTEELAPNRMPQIQPSTPRQF